MKENKLNVESCVDCIVVIDKPEYHIKKTWNKRGAKVLFDRDVLEEMFYDTGVETLFKQGYLKCTDKEFLVDMGLVTEDEKPIVVELTDQLLKRLIGAMPMDEFKKTLAKLLPNQILDVADYAIEHSEDLKMDKADILSKMTGKNILQAIQFAKADEEA